MSTTIPAAVLVPFCLLAQAPVDGTKAADAAAERLEFMKESAKSYKFTIGGDRASELALKPEPAFRLGKQGDGVVLEGAIFLWEDEVGRPGAAAQVFLVQVAGRSGGQWRHELISRYGKAGGTPEDGALFAFVLGTDPESFLFIEARPGDSGLEWQYAFAPMTCWALKAEHKGRPVWSLPQRNSDIPLRTSYSRVYEP
jgi:hypothetical protein